MLALVANCLAATRPITVVTITGWLTAAVSSVCPPIISTDTSFAARSASVMISSTSCKSEPAGNNRVKSTATGSAPLAATSLHDTCTASQPACLAAPVIGSVARTHKSPAKSSAAESSPNDPLRTTSGLRLPSLLNINCCKAAGDNFPTYIVNLLVLIILAC